MKDVFNYDPNTGVITWAVKRGNRYKAGDTAGHITDSGYMRISYKKKFYMVHRLAWFLTYGSWPNHSVDHINQDKTDNRLANLRDVTNAENQKNRSAYKNNKSGTVGVGWHKAAKKWVAQIGVEGSVIHLGTFNDKEEAVNIRKEAELKYGFHKNHGIMI